MEEQVEKEPETKQYAKQYWSRRRTHNAARRAAGAHGGGGAPVRTRWPAIVPNNDIPQSEMKTHMPPGASIWRNNTAGAWAVHVGPWYRSYPWSKGGPLESGREACQCAWKLHMMLQGEGLSSCTVDGLFPVGSREVPSADPTLAPPHG